MEETKYLVKHHAVEFLGEVKCFKHYTDSEGVERTHEDFSIAMCEDFKNIAMFIHLDLIENPGKAMVKERKSRFHHEISVLSKNSNVRRELK